MKFSLSKRSVDAAEDAEEVVAAGPKFSFQTLINDFQTLDPRDPGLWPAAPRAVILLALLATLITSAWWFGWDAQNEELDQKIAEEVTLREDWYGKKKQAVNLDAYRKQLVEIGNSFGTLLEQLPNQTEIGDLLVDINKAAQSRGLVVELFKPGPEQRRDFYAEKPITIKLVGGYHDIAAFAGDVAQLPRIVTLNEIDLTVIGTPSAPAIKGTSTDVRMTMNTTARTFRYLDDAEIAATRKKGK
jgi:type IV pilus assembly protein PilO